MLAHFNAYHPAIAFPSNKPPSTLRRRKLKTEVSLRTEMNQMFSVHTTREELKKIIITGHFGFVFEKALGQRNRIIIVRL